jgi:broad specificity phosphatase PhoE
MDKLEYRKHISAMSTEGFALQTVKYERLSKWNYVIYQLYLAESLIDSLQRREPVLGDLKDANQCTALFHSAVMSYGRCFVGTALGLPSLDPKRVFQGASLVRVTHDELMDIRHNLIAHTGCPASAPMRQKGQIEIGRIFGPS